MSKSPQPYILMAFVLLLACLSDFGPSDVEAEQATADATRDAITQAQADHQAERLAQAFAKGGAQ